MAERGSDELRYTAFLSYSHKDAKPASRLHRRLESFRMPRRLVGKTGARGPVPERLWPIFRDREELPAATDLSETVREALDKSGALIVLCSPHAAQSLWVAEEIRTFREIHPDRPILAAVLDGDPPDSFPAALRAFGQDGTWHEPLATDLRPHADGERLGLLKLVAGITGVGLDDLVQRDASRRIRRVTAVTAVAVAAMLVMAVLTVVALRARAEAERQQAAAEGLIEFMLTDLRERLRGVGRLDILTAVNRRALEHYGDQQSLDELSAEALDRRARILHAMGEDDMARDNRPAALAAFREAHRTTAEQLERLPNSPDRIFAHAQSEFWVGYVDYQNDNFGAAQRSFERYKALAYRLMRSNPSNPLWVKEASYADGNLCSVALAEPVNATVAVRSCTSALQLMIRAQALGGSNPTIMEDLANRHAWMADAYRSAGERGRAMEHRRIQEEILDQLIDRDPMNVDIRDMWLTLQIALAKLESEVGQRSSARRRLRSAQSVAEGMIARDRSNQMYRQRYSTIIRDLSQM